MKTKITYALAALVALAAPLLALAHDGSSACCNLCPFC